jgi:hypothetical protein
MVLLAWYSIIKLGLWSIYLGVLAPHGHVLSVGLGSIPGAPRPAPHMGPVAATSLWWHLLLKTVNLLLLLHPLSSPLLLS